MLCMWFCRTHSIVVESWLLVSYSSRFNPFGTRFLENPVPLPLFLGIVKKLLPILHISQRLKQAFPKPPLVTSKNLWNVLVRANMYVLTPPTNTGNTACSKKRCKTYGLLYNNKKFERHVTGSNITSEHTSHVYKSKTSYIWLHARNVVYNMWEKQRSIYISGWIATVLTSTQRRWRILSKPTSASQAIL